jgi:shikimate dehydrogenase
MATSKIAKEFILMGSPIAHSLSPILHNIFASQFGIEISYKLQEANVNNYRNFIDQFIDLNGSGINVTAPLKTHVFKDLKHIDETARLANAVNTLVIKNGLLHGYNTDGIGLLCDLKRKAIPIHNSDILILGAGGAVRGILGPLLSEHPKSVTIVNRDFDKAKAVAADFKNMGMLNVKAEQDLPYITATLIINATSGTPEYLDKLNFNNSLCYDLNYIPETTQFTKTALINGALGAYNGLGMLIEQAAAAFALWHKVHPDTKNMLKQLQGI